MHDPKHYLPDKGPDPFRRRPEFSRYEANDRRARPRRQRHVPGRAPAGAESRRVRAGGSTTNFTGCSRSERADVGRPMAMSSIEIKAKSAAGLRRPTVGAAVGGRRSAGRRDQARRSRCSGTARVGSVRLRAGLGGQKSRCSNSLSRRRWWGGGRTARRWCAIPSCPRPRQDPTAARPDNAFMLGAEDPRGLNCPFGAHIRRANPRDTRFHGTPEESRTEVEGVNRHRILRVGRGYDLHRRGAPQGASTPGCCSCASTRTSSANSSSSRRPGCSTGTSTVSKTKPTRSSAAASATSPFPHRTGPCASRSTATSSEVIGGGYFFMPGRAALRYLTRRHASEKPRAVRRYA